MCVSHLGLGNFGTVYLAYWFEKVRSTKCAVKVLRGRDANSNEDNQAIWEQKKREFLQEVQTMERLDHVNICRLHGVALTSSPLLVAIEHVAFGDLFTMLRTFKQFGTVVTEPEQIYLGMQIARGLQYITEQRCTSACIS